MIFAGINFFIVQRLNNKHALLLSVSGWFYFLVVGILARGGRLEVFVRNAGNLCML